MATNIEIQSAFVEPWNKNTPEHPSWGMKTADTHSRKDDDGKYQTVGRTFRTVKVSKSSGIDLTQFVKGERVSIWGREVTEEREHDGKKYYDLIVWADRVERAGGTASTSATVKATEPETWAPTAPANPVAAQGDVWNQGTGAVDDGLPF